MSERGRLVRSAAGFAFSALALYGGLRLLQEGLSFSNGNDQPVLPQERFEKWLARVQAGTPADLLERQLIEEYFVARRSFGDFSEYQLRRNLSVNTKEFIRKERVALAFDGVLLLRLVDGNYQIDIDYERKLVQLRDKIFDFNRNYDLFILDRIVYQSLLRRPVEPLRMDSFRSDEEVRDLMWLAKQNLPLVFETDRYPQSGLLLNMARFYKTLMEMGYPVPARTIFRDHREGDPGGGWWRDADRSAYVTNLSDHNTPIHEALHQQAKENNEFSQARYNEMVERVLSQTGLDWHDSGIYANNGVLVEEEKRGKDGVSVEDYAENLKIYFVDGVGFRWKLNELYVGNWSKQSAVLQAKYDFAKSFYRNSQYLRNGEEFEPRAGDVFDIRDPQGRERGVQLRPFPSFYDNREDYPQVFLGDVVHVVEGPVSFFHPHLGRMERMYRVQLRRVAEQPSGWIWERWLGDKLGIVKLEG